MTQSTFTLKQLTIAGIQQSLPDSNTGWNSPMAESGDVRQPSSASSNTVPDSDQTGRI
jgi:hypothetical protein